MKIKLLNGSGSLIRSIFVRLFQLLPVFLIVAIAYGDKFLPYPLNSWSYQTRTKINNALVGSFDEDVLENNKYNNKKTDEIIEQVEKDARGNN